MNWNFTCPKQKEEFTFDTFNSVDNLPQNIWDSVLNNKNIYLSIPYLKAIESSMNHEISFRYSVYYHHDKPVAISYAQIVNFTDVHNKYKDSLANLGSNLKNKLLSRLNLRALICGNVYNCGENGFYFNDEIDEKDAFKLLSRNLFNIRNEEKDTVSVVMAKEFWPDTTKNSDHLKTLHFNDFSIDVNMVLPIHKDWSNYDDYLASMTTKFRTKSNSVYKKSSEITSKDFTYQDIDQNKYRLKELFENVIERAAFAFGNLTIDSFVQLKKELNNNYLFKGYYIDDKLIGFSNAVLSSDLMDANFVGIDYEYNNKYALYQRMLYDFVHDAIDNNVTELRLGRTAEEIKSCTGAQPFNMKLYVRHTSLLQNTLLKPFVESISPSEFNLRKPFKANFELSIKKATF